MHKGKVYNKDQRLPMNPIKRLFWQTVRCTIKDFHTFKFENMEEEILSQEFIYCDVCGLQISTAEIEGIHKQDCNIYRSYWKE